MPTSPEQMTMADEVTALIANLPPLEVAAHLTRVLVALGDNHDWDSTVTDAVWENVAPLVSRLALPGPNQGGTVGYWQRIGQSLGLEYDDEDFDF